MSAPSSSASSADGRSRLAKQCQSALQSRGIELRMCEERSGKKPLASEFTAQFRNGASVYCMLIAEIPTARDSAVLSTTVAEEVRSGVPPVLLIPLPLSTEDAPDSSRGDADQHAAGMALLRASGAIVLRDPSVWLECIVMLTAHGIPKGPNGAIVAEPGAWLALAAASLQHRAEALGERFSPLAAGLDADAATDFVLTDASVEDPQAHRALAVTVGAFHDAEAKTPCLLGLAGALAAAEAAGHASRRIEAGQGPADEADAPYDDIDEARFDRQLEKLHDRVGDHECKVLLSSYGVSITRQAVATTPSAATRIAKKAGYPVQIKAWGPNMPSEPDGALVLTDVQTAADVRRAFSAVCAQTNSEAVIIRETPPVGREVRIRIRTIGDIGPVCFLYQRGQRAPAAALAPLRRIDADAMARQVVASRVGDQDPDWGALADLLIHASHMAADNPRVQSVDLGRVLIGHQGEGAVVVDAQAVLAPS